MPENAALAQDTASRCAANAGAVLPFMTTANTARDMDQIRQALAEEKISYLGFSYGTYLGAVYASLFPQRTDRFVLDSVVNAKGVWRDQFRMWGPATEERFPDFTNWAAARDGTFHLGATPADVRRTFFRLATRLDGNPIVLPDGLAFTGNIFREYMRSGIYYDSSFTGLAKLWQAVDQNDLATVDAFAQSLRGITDKQMSALLGVLCDDVAWPRLVAQYEWDVRVDGLLYPLAGAMAANMWACASWSIQPREPLVPITSNGPRNILLLQNRRDPATPYLGALVTRQLLGQRASMITVDQGGHVAYLLTPNACVTERVTNYLVAGSLPADSSCGANPTAARTQQGLATTSSRQRAVEEFLRRQVMISPAR